jgi:hypothetical protein
MGSAGGSSKKAGGRKQPTGKEVMKRRTPDDLSLQPARFESDPKKAYTTEQLAEIGAISLKWNQVEAHIDFVGSFIMFAKSPFWLRLSVDRMLGSPKKFQLLKECLERAELLDATTQQCIADCFAQIDQCRAYRNAILHHHIYDHEKGIGSYIDESRSPFQILVSMEALKALYGILCSLLEELREIDLVFRIETDAQRPGRLDKTTGEFRQFGVDELKNRILPEHRKRLVALQKARKELPKLPQFPDSDFIRSMNKGDVAED